MKIIKTAAYLYDLKEFGKKLLNWGIEQRDEKRQRVKNLILVALDWAKGEETDEKIIEEALIELRQMVTNKVKNIDIYNNDEIVEIKNIESRLNKELFHESPVISSKKNKFKQN